MTENRTDIRQNKDLFLRGVRYLIRPDFRINQLNDSEILKVIEDNLGRWEIGEFNNQDSILHYENLSFGKREKSKIGINQLISMDFYIIDRGKFKIIRVGDKRYIKFIFTDRSAMIKTIYDILKGIFGFALFSVLTLIIMDKVSAVFVLIASYSFFGLIFLIRYFYPFLRYKILIKRILMKEELRINEL